VNPRPPADKLLAEGYGIRRTERDFELVSVSRELIEKFSKRTLEIERLCREKYTVLEARARKLMRETGWILPTRSQVKAEVQGESNWRSQLTPQERESLKIINVRGGQTQDLLEHLRQSRLLSATFSNGLASLLSFIAAAIFLRCDLGKVRMA
jgi:hypothetical protein